MFKPKRIIFETGALDYQPGRDILAYFKNTETEIFTSPLNKVKTYIPGETPVEQYFSGKSTLVVGVKKSLTFQSCKPSAHYQLPLVSGCTGQCEYCYLNTQLGDKPYVRVFVNRDEILARAARYIKERLPETTVFEGAATSDPVPVEPYTASLGAAINFFAGQQNAKFRFVTKYTDIDSLLQLEHNNRTEIRFSLNTERVIKSYEHKTASARMRIEASSRLFSANYPMGFIIAPVILYDGWQEEYRQLLLDLHSAVVSASGHPIVFEIITHRYTAKAKNIIAEIFPETTLDMENEKRQFKFGQFGYGKYVYPKESMAEVKAFFTHEINKIFKNGVIKYII